jgi:hypothetical protein
VTVWHEMTSFVVVLARRGEVCGNGAAGSLGETGYPQVHYGAAAGGDLVHLGQLAAGAGEADLQALGFAEPPVGFGFGDAGHEVVANLGEAVALGGVGSQQWTAQASLTELAPGSRRVVSPPS